MTCFYLPCDINKAVLIETNQVPIEIRGVKSKVKETIMKLNHCFVILSIGWLVPYYIPALKEWEYIGLVSLHGVS